MKIVCVLACALALFAVANAQETADLGPVECVNPEVNSRTVSETVPGTGSYTTEVTTTTGTCVCLNWNKTTGPQDDGPDDPTPCVEGVDGNDVWQLKNHPDGNAGAPLYGLRLDGFFRANPTDTLSTTTTFSFECAQCNVRMDRYKTDGLHIYGVAFGGTRGSNAKTGYLFIDVWYPTLTRQYDDSPNGGLYSWTRDAYGIFHFLGDTSTGAPASIYVNTTVNGRRFNGQNNMYFRFVNQARGSPDAGEGWVNPISNGVAFRKTTQDFLFTANCVSGATPLADNFYEEGRDAAAIDCEVEDIPDFCTSLGRKCLPPTAAGALQCGPCVSGKVESFADTHGPNGICA